ncbi:MAG TPA: histidine kinase N-terminal 7TM domain-containing protein, partial [Bacteroidia bacterium]|nr:histidine kinase N-terminal 7TM domain-containing protein [Bacteroidia bacterium]
MKMESLLAFGSAGLGAFLALGAALKAGRSPDRWAFAAGMATLALERCFSGLMGSAVSPNAAFQWQVWRLTVIGCIPGIWLLFSLGYARGNAREFLRKWLYPLGVAFALPLSLVLLYRTRFIASTELIEGSRMLIFRLTGYGSMLHLLVLVAAILVLVNLEHTFRSAVGTVRWRIKFMLMGVGVLFLVRLFTVSQTLLFGSIDPRLDILHSGALVVAGILILRSLLRTGHFNLDVHPSHSVLQGSVTIFLVGVYLLLVGVLSKVVAYLGGDYSFASKALVVLVLLVLLAILLQSDRVRMHLGRFVSRH